MVGEFIIDALANGEEICMTGVLRLGTKVLPARKGRNPATGEVMTFPEKRVVTVKPLSHLKNAVEGKEE